MEVDERPTEQYSDIGGLDKQIQEVSECPWFLLINRFSTSVFLSFMTLIHNFTKVWP